MWEAYGMENEDFLWASKALWGGIAGHQKATCGAVAGAVVALGLSHRCPSSDKEKAAAERKAVEEDAAELGREFLEKFGDVTCIGLLGVDMSNEEGRKQARDNGLFEQKCHRYLPFIIEKLYQLEEKRDAT
jgi:C_GCAxxG_C_C family probable redox protein